MTPSLKIHGTPPQLALVLAVIQSSEYTALEPVIILSTTETVTAGDVSVTTTTTLEDDVVSAESTFGKTAAPGADSKAPPPPPDDGKAPPPPPPADIELHLATNKTDMIPWSAQIHGKKKAVNANGTWKLAQGVDRAVLVPNIEAELVAQMAAAPAATTQTAAEKNEANVDKILAQTGDDVVDTVPTTFAELLPIMMAARAANELDTDGMQAAADVLGLVNIGALNNSPHLVAQAFELMALKLPE